MTGYHCSPSATLTFAAGRTLCVADDANVAAMYLRGGDDVAHYLYTVEWDDTLPVASGAEMIAAWSRIHRREHDEGEIPTYEVAKDRRVRAALIAAGFAAVEYGDTHEGLSYTTTEFFRPSESVRVVRTERLDPAAGE